VTDRVTRLAAKIRAWWQGVIKMSAIAYEPGKRSRSRTIPARSSPIVAAAFFIGICGPAAIAEPAHGQTTITCSNPASGTTWQITIDFDRRTVDGHAATIDDSTIAWRDPGDQGNYALDRKSGNLRVAVPSSTGGYFLHDQCKLEK
jgi:hypothetical protein